MDSSKRLFLKTAAAALATPLAGCATTAVSFRNGVIGVDAFPPPIDVRERQQRVARAQALMHTHQIDAILLEPGSAMAYFSGIDWWRSERLVAVIIPAQGDIAVVAPHFEEPSIRELMTFGDDVRTWQEHDDPFALVNGILSDRGLAGSRRLGLEDTVRYFVPDGLRRSAPELDLVAATPVTLGCRMYKSDNELRLMRAANQVTLSAYEEVMATISEGMTGDDIKQRMNAAQAARGGKSAWSIALIGPASAYPHGTKKQAPLRRGDIVLMDAGCGVHGYKSDISRTFVLGAANSEQRTMWNHVREGQERAMVAARLGVPAGKVDDTVRAWYASLGYGPGYATPGLSHRTGHGIGMDGHEPVNFVHGETTPLAPGMCFSNEPGLYDFSRFGVRIEDCLYMTEDGAKWFTEPPDSIDAPLGRMGPVI
ncbi:MAG: Xaa-Pro peptidase family protein [Pseudomonadota bacterium]